MNQRFVLGFAVLIASALAFAQQSGGANSGGAMSGGGSDEVGNVAEAGLILITTRDPSSYIATADGAALYTLVDENNEVLPCNAECLEAWPPYTGEASADEGTGLSADLVGTTQTEDGQEIVTYNDYPLYTFTGDQNPVDVTGQAVEGFGGTWYVIGEDGEPFIENPTTGEGG
jgi:predicted lipoprotein with Yx(FWY)xxD motif